MQVNRSIPVAPTQLRCRKCDHALAPPPAHGESIRCARCGMTVTNRDGVIDFLSDVTTAEHAHSVTEMQQLNQDASQRGWFASLLDHFHLDHFHNIPDKLAYICDPVRLAWFFHCYDTHANDRCVCVGSDWGALILPLSRFFETAYSVDDDLEKLRFQAIRAADEGVDNLHILRTPLLQLPLADDSVDLVLISGGLAWIGLRDPSRPPSEVQEALLHEVRRVLKPSGLLYLGAKNWLSAHHVLDVKEVLDVKKRGGVCFINSLSRRMISALTRRYRAASAEATGSSRSFTYSAWGYERLLCRTGFAHSTLYWTWPSYAYPRMSGPLDGYSVRYMVEKVAFQSAGRPIRLLARLAYHLPNWVLGLLIRLFAPQFLIVASQQTDEHTLQTQIMDRSPPPHSFVRLSMGVNARVNTTFLLINQANEVYKAVRVTETPSRADSRSTFTTEESEGIRGRPLRPYAQGDVRAAGRWLAEFHQRTHSGMGRRSALIDEISALARSTSELLDDERTRALLHTYTQRYTQTVQSWSLSMTGEHGDYTLPNLLMREEDETNALRVIDWEFQRRQGNPLMDIGAFLLSLLRSHVRTGEFPAQIETNTPFSWFVAEYKTDENIPFHLAPGYYLLRVLDRVQRQPASPAISYLLLAQWIPLLRPTLDFGVNAASGIRHVGRGM